MIASLRTFRVYIRRYRMPLFLGAVLAVAEVLVRLAEPWPLRVVVDHVLAAGAGPFAGVQDRRVILAIAVGALIVVVAVAASRWALAPRWWPHSFSVC
jgi:ATP-binding cassette subfamily B protein